jgi:hypothetical protein
LLVALTDADDEVATAPEERESIAHAGSCRPRHDGEQRLPMRIIA